MAVNFNHIAPIYDTLVRLVFGKALWNAQQVHLSAVESTDSVLIIGGGTGRNLHWLPAACQITYLEPSSKMMELAKKVRPVNFIASDFLSYSDHSKFDVIICPFVLDVFSESDLHFVIEKLYVQLKEGGSLIVTDFRYTGKWRHKTLINLMLLFFRWAANLRLTQLQPIQTRLEASTFRRISTKSFRNGLIFSDLYKK